MSDNVLTYLLGDPRSSSFDTDKRVNPSWFTPSLSALRSSSQPELGNYTFAELKSQVKALGSGLRKAGMQDGARLMLMSSDSVEYALLMLGTWAAGGIFVARGIHYTAAQQAHHIKNAEPTVIITEAAYKDTAAEAVRIVYSSFDSIYEIEAVRSQTPPSEGSRSWNSLLDFTGGPSYVWPRLSTREQMESTLFIEYTSGYAVTPLPQESPRCDTDPATIYSTTSTPKGVEHTHSSITNWLEMVPTNAASSTPSCCLCDLTWEGVGSKFIFFESLITRMCHIVYDNPGPFSIVTYLTQVSQHRPQTIRMSKRTLDALVLRGEDSVKPDLSDVRSITTGAQTIPSKTQLAVRDLCNGRDILDIVYGTTELLTLTSKRSGTGSVASSCVGKLKVGIAGKVVDDAGNTVKDGQEGKLLFRTPARMKGYWRNPESTALSIDAEGYFDTGDLGFVDKSSDEWHVTGRTKELIKVSGRNVIPQAIEETLLSIPNVGIAVVVGVTKEDREEMPTAFIVRAKDEIEQPQTDDVHAVMKKEMDVLHQITGGLVWLRKAELPYGGNGKVARLPLKHRAQRMWDEGKMGKCDATSQ